MLTEFTIRILACPDIKEHHFTDPPKLFLLNVCHALSIQTTFC